MCAFDKKLGILFPCGGVSVAIPVCSSKLITDISTIFDKERTKPPSSGASGLTRNLITERRTTDSLSPPITIEEHRELVKPCRKKDQPDTSKALPPIPSIQVEWRPPSSVYSRETSGGSTQLSPTDSESMPESPTLIKRPNLANDKNSVYSTNWPNPSLAPKTLPIIKDSNHQFEKHQKKLQTQHSSTRPPQLLPSLHSSPKTSLQYSPPSIEVAPPTPQTPPYISIYLDLWQSDSSTSSKLFNPFDPQIVYNEGEYDDGSFFNIIHDDDRPTKTHQLQYSKRTMGDSNGETEKSGANFFSLDNHRHFVDRNREPTNSKYFQTGHDDSRHQNSSHQGLGPVPAPLNWKKRNSSPVPTRLNSNYKIISGGQSSEPALSNVESNNTPRTGPSSCELHNLSPVSPLDEYDPLYTSKPNGNTLRSWENSESYNAQEIEHPTKMVAVKLRSQGRTLPKLQIPDQRTQGNFHLPTRFPDSTEKLSVIFDGPHRPQNLPLSVRTPQSPNTSDQGLKKPNVRLPEDKRRTLRRSLAIKKSRKFEENIKYSRETESEHAIGNYQSKRERFSGGWI